MMVSWLCTGNPKTAILLACKETFHVIRIITFPIFVRSSTKQNRKTSICMQTNTSYVGFVCWTWSSTPLRFNGFAIVSMDGGIFFSGPPTTARHVCQFGYLSPISHYCLPFSLEALPYLVHHPQPISGNTLADLCSYLVLMSSWSSLL